MGLQKVYHRQYALRWSALELFFLDRSNHFVDFFSAAECKRIHR